MSGRWNPVTRACHAAWQAVKTTLAFSALMTNVASREDAPSLDEGNHACGNGNCPENGRCARRGANAAADAENTRNMLADRSKPLIILRMMGGAGGGKNEFIRRILQFLAAGDPSVGIIGGGIANTLTKENDLKLARVHVFDRMTKGNMAYKSRLSVTASPGTFVARPLLYTASDMERMDCMAAGFPLHDYLENHNLSPDMRKFINVHQHNGQSTVIVLVLEYRTACLLVAEDPDTSSKNAMKALHIYLDYHTIIESAKKSGQQCILLVTKLDLDEDLTGRHGSTAQLQRCPKFKELQAKLAPAFNMTEDRIYPAAFPPELSALGLFVPPHVLDGPGALLKRAIQVADQDEVPWKDSEPCRDLFFKTRSALLSERLGLMLPGVQFNDDALEDLLQHTDYDISAAALHALMTHQPSPSQRSSPVCTSDDDDW